ncbi:hypothetical protein Tco_0363235 [Tanacetum coccineum]
MAEDGKIKIDKFDGHDFGFWKMQIEDYLYWKKLHEPLEKAKPTGMKAEDWTLLDRQALDVVRLSLTKNKDSILQAGNPVNEIFLKLNLPDHRSILTDSKIYIKMDVEAPDSSRLKDS